MWDVNTGKELAVWLVFAPKSAHFSPDGGHIVVACMDGATRVLDSMKGKEIAVLDGDENIVTSADFSPDGKRIFAASGQAARVWDVVTAKEIAVLSGHQNYVLFAAFNPNGARIATADLEGTIRLWNARTGAQLRVLHGDTVTSVAFSPDGNKLVTSGLIARLWDAATGQQLATLSGHEAVIWSAQFSPDGRRIITGLPRQNRSGVGCGDRQPGCDFARAYLWRQKRDVCA